MALKILLRSVFGPDILLLSPLCLAAVRIDITFSSVSGGGGGGGGGGV